MCAQKSVACYHVTDSPSSYNKETERNTRKEWPSRLRERTVKRRKKSNHKPWSLTQRMRHWHRRTYCVCGASMQEREHLTHPWGPNWNQTCSFLQMRGKFRDRKWLFFSDKRSEVGSKHQRRKIKESHLCLFANVPCAHGKSVFHCPLESKHTQENSNSNLRRRSLSHACASPHPCNPCVCVCLWKPARFQLTLCRHQCGLLLFLGSV